MSCRACGVGGVARALVEHIALLTPGCDRFVVALDTVRETGNVEVFERMGFEVVADHPSELFESDRHAELHEVKMERRLGHETQAASGEARQIC